jgi:hypothetical protein
MLVILLNINITNPFVKILGNPIKNWTENYKENEELSGFTKGPSTVDLCSRKDFVLCLR